MLAVSGTKAHAEALRVEASEVLSTMGLRLSPEKTLITHIDEGFDFLGWRIQRHRKRGTSNTYYVYVYPAKKALNAAMAKIKAICWQNTNQPLDVLLIRLNRFLRGWTAHFRYGCSSATFNYLRAYTWKRVFGWWPSTPAQHLEATPSPQHQRRMVARHSGCETVQPGRGEHHAIPLPRNTDSQPVAEHCMR